MENRDCMMYLSLDDMKKLGKCYQSSKNGPVLRLRGVLVEAMKRNGIATQAQLCAKTGTRITETHLSKLLKEGTTRNRDVLWVLALALHMGIEETERLFNSVGQSINPCISNAVSDRERLIKTFISIRGRDWDIEDLDEELAKRGMQKICQ